MNRSTGGCLTVLAAVVWPMLAVAAPKPPGADVRWRLQRVLAPDAANAGDRFGAAVAVGPSTVLVGAPHRRESGIGAAFVFEPGAGLLRLDPRYQPATWFGHALDLDRGRAVIGAPFLSGGVRVFEAGKTWQPAALLQPGAITHENFGWSLALDGDRMVVGAPQAPGGGRVHLFLRSGGGWRPVGQLRGEGNGDELGTSVALSGGLLAVGAPGANSTAGVVHVYSWIEAGVVKLASLRPADRAAGDRFGEVVAASGHAVAVGAPGRHRDGASGAAYLFEPRVGTATWPGQRLIVESLNSTGTVGAALALDADLLIVGAPGADGDSDHPGSVHLFRRTGAGRWAALEALPAPDPWAGGFGRAVALAGSVLVVGAPAATPDPTVPRSGVVYMFSARNTDPSQRPVGAVEPRTVPPAPATGGCTLTPGANSPSKGAWMVLASLVCLGLAGRRRAW